MPTIAIINNELLNKKLLLSINFDFSWNSLTVLSWSLFWVHMNAIVITENSNDVDIGPNNYVQNSAIKKVLFDKKRLSFFWKDFSHKTSVNCHLLYFS